MDDSSSVFRDPYHRFRRPEPTPPDELCRCVDGPPVKLMQALGPNPLACMRCHGEVQPETLPLPEELVDPVAQWSAVYDALDRLWLDSGAYETWAAAELANIDSSVNRAGLELRAQIDPVRRCYYWLFADAPHGNLAASSTDVAPHCPICSTRMTAYDGGRIAHLVCEACSLVTANGALGIESRPTSRLAR